MNDRRAHRVAGMATTVFSRYSALARRHRALNLGQGYPDFDGPPEIKEAARRAISEGLNQYAMSPGLPELRQAISEHAQRFYRQAVDPETMVTVTSGGTEALFDAILALVNVGDEVVLFEPFFDSHPAAVAMAGGVCRYIRLRPPEGGSKSWWYEPTELEAAFSAKTKLVVLNTPHNPTGKVYTREELAHLAELCERHDVLLLSDEVYEHLTFDPAVHVRPSTVEGLADRTVTVSSGGKSFSFTGWKVGWVIAPPPLREAVQSAHQFVTFATPGPFQAAIAMALKLADSYFAQFRQDYRRRRALLLEGLSGVGLRAIAPEGTYFAMVPVADAGFDDDEAFCQHLIERAGVAAIPTSALYARPEAKENRQFVRFAFCKTDAVLTEAAERLRAWRVPSA